VVDAPPPSGAPVAPATVEDHAFWTWIAAHVGDLRAITRGDEPIMDELAARLRAVDPGLAFEVGVGTAPFELIISADGVRDKFPVVQRLVAAAPPITGLEPIAFRPRKSADFGIRIEGIELGAGDVWFTATPAGATLDVVLYVRGLDGTRDDVRKYATYVLLDTLLGEYDVETRLGGIEWRAAPTAPAAPLRPLTELPAEVDRLK